MLERRVATVLAAAAGFVLLGASAAYADVLVVSVNLSEPASYLRQTRTFGRAVKRRHRCAARSRLPGVPRCSCRL